MIHRHLDYRLETPSAELPVATVVDIFDRGSRRVATTHRRHRS